MQFINREQEKKDLIAHLETEPNAILFLYGPKSCGKTSLIEKVINDLDQKKYAINYLNLRGLIIDNFKSFLDVFFQPKTKGLTQKAKDIIKGITLNIGFFKVNIDDEAMFAKNPFKIMEDQLRVANQKNIKPVIVIDELQNLKSIYTNGEKRLLDELFALFIRFTKETHLAHVILATSDSYFIEEIHSSAKLSKTCIFKPINHLDKKDIKEWLSQEEYQFNTKDIDCVWEKLGGSPWEIWQVVVDVQKGDSVKEAVDCRINSLKHSVLMFYEGLDKESRLKFEKISKHIVKNKFFLKTKDEDLFDIIKKAIEDDMWFYDTFDSTITANSRSLEIVFKEIFK